MHQHLLPPAHYSADAGTTELPRLRLLPPISDSGPRRPRRGLGLLIGLVIADTAAFIHLTGLLP